MRRALITVTLGSVLLTSAACGTAAEPKVTGSTGAPPPAAAQASAAQASAAGGTAPGAASGASANTKAVCTDVQKVFNNDTAPIGAALAMMVVYKQQKDSVRAEKSEAEARNQLKAVAANLKKATAGAEDATIRTAGQTSAAKFTAAAADKKSFDKLKSSADLEGFLDARMADWVTPISGYCGG